MRIDEAREQRGVAEIDDLRVGRDLHSAARRDDALALDQHSGTVDQGAGGGIEQVRRPEREPGRRRGWLWTPAVDLPFLHHERDLLHRGDVAERIAGHGDHVREQARFQ